MELSILHFDLNIQARELINQPLVIDNQYECNSPSTNMKCTISTWLTGILFISSMVRFGKLIIS